MPDTCRRDNPNPVEVQNLPRQTITHILISAQWRSRVGSKNRRVEPESEFRCHVLPLYSGHVLLEPQTKSDIKINTYIIVLVVKIVFWEIFIFFCVLFILLLACHGPRGCFAHHFDFMWVSTAHLSPGKIKHHISVAL